MKKEDMLKEFQKINEKVKVEEQRKKFEFDKFKGFVIKTTKPYDTKEKYAEYIVRIACENKDTQIIYPNLECKEFLYEEEADSYYDKLNSLVSKEYLENLID